MPLPDSVLAKAELAPIEDIMLAILREGLPDVQVQSLITPEMPRPIIVVRRVPGFGNWRGDMRFTDAARIAVHVYCDDPNGDEDAAILSEAVRVVLREASFAKTNVPGLGSITSIEMTQEPTRKSDWATTTGPVQYADLPSGVWRYETSYFVRIRKPIG